MPVTVQIPAALRPFARDRSEVAAAGATVREVVADLVRRHPGMEARLLDDAGSVRRHLSLFLNDQDVRLLGELDAAVRDGDRLTLVAAIAGGR